MNRSDFGIGDRVLVDGKVVETVVPTARRLPETQIDLMDATGRVRTVDVRRLTLLSAMPGTVPSVENSLALHITSADLRNRDAFVAWLRRRLSEEGTPA